MEYLMTYGWAILVISVVLGVLFQLGVFSSSSFSVRAPPGVCQVLRTSAAVNLVGQCSGVLPQYVAQFNGQNSYVDLGASTGLVNTFNNGNAFTYSLWFFPKSTIAGTNWEWLFAKEYTSHVSPYYQVDLLYYGTTSTNGYISSRVSRSDVVSSYIGASSVAGSVPLNSWYFAAVVVDLSANTMKLYINGVLADSTSSAVGTYTNYNTHVAVGADINIPTTSPYVFSGSIANVQIYNTSISVTEIQASYAEGIGGAPILPTRLVGWWPLNGNANDYSGNNNNGYPANMAYSSQYGK
jgi:hypothetical protein